MRKIALLALAVSLGACATGQPLKAQDWGAPSYGNYGATAYGYGWTARPRFKRTKAARGEASLAAEVLAEINRARTNPQRYAERLRALRADYHGDVVRAPGDEAGVEPTRAWPR